MKPYLLRSGHWLCLALLWGCFCPSLLAQGYVRHAPYSGIRWADAEDETPEVYVNHTWYALHAVDDISTSALVAFAKTQFAEQWQERFSTDLTLLLGRMGHRLKESVKLKLADLESGQEIVMPAVSLSSQKRAALIQSFAVRSRLLTSEEVLADLNQFEQGLEAQFSYLRANSVDYKAALNILRTRAQEGLTVDVLGRELQKIIALFIDGHASVSGYRLPRGFLPFLVEPVGLRFVAFKPDRTAFLDPDYPYLATLDDVPLARWLEAGASLIVQGAPQYKKRHGLRLLRQLNYLRGELGIPVREEVRVTLVSEDGLRFKRITLPAADQVPLYGKWPLRATQRLKGNIGYLRLERMHEASVEAVKTWMPKFRDTEGLIVDVRHNGGGSREALRELFPYLMQATDAPYVVNVAKYRLDEGFGEDHLEARFAYRETDPRWTEAERASIKQFKQSFQPEWNPPEDAFSAWHYMLMSRAKNDPRYSYDKPVVVLMDEKCFSATDIFLSALKGWRNVTLIGRASGGGSARSQTFELVHSGLRTRVGSMASFQKTGALYDARGVHPDLWVEPTPSYYLHNGADHILDFAITFLNSASQEK